MADSHPKPEEGSSQGRRERWRFADHLEDMISIHALDGTYRYISAASLHLLGYAPEELAGSDSYSHFHPDDVERVAFAHESALGGAPFTVAYRLRRKDGEYIWVETATKLISSADEGDADEVVCSTRAIDPRRSPTITGGADPALELSRIERVLSEGLISVYQPIFELEARRVIAIEALARFPGNPAHTTESWFADAWEVGLGVPLELQAARTATEAIEAMDGEIELFVNASPQVVAAPGFLKSLGSAVSRITVEITEHLKVHDWRQLELELRAFREAGGRLAIDDFGAGYASFRHILEIKPHWIKLDRSLTAQLGESDLARSLAEAVISFGASAGIEVIAEGISSPEELNRVIEIGIRYGQGFHLAPPGPLELALAAGGPA